MSTEVSKEFESKVDEVVTHYPVSKRSASLPLLHLWQEEFGFVSDEGISWIAEKLGLEPINILELVTFYPMFRREKIGNVHIRVCRTLSCALNGSYEVYEHFRKLTGASGDEHGPVTSPDGKYTVEFVECLASCGSAPIVMVNEDTFEKVDANAAEDIVKKYA